MCLFTQALVEVCFNEQNYFISSLRGFNIVGAWKIIGNADLYENGAWAYKFDYFLICTLFIGQDHLLPEAEEITMISIQLAARFLFTTGFHTKKIVRGSASDWYIVLDFHSYYYWHLVWFFNILLYFFQALIILFQIWNAEFKKPW